MWLLPWAVGFLEKNPALALDFFKGFRGEMQVQLNTSRHQLGNADIAKLGVVQIPVEDRVPIGLIYAALYVLLKNEPVAAAHKVVQMGNRLPPLPSCS